jgi:hypothetical protein
LNTIKHLFISVQHLFNSEFMTQKQERWRQALTDPSASSKLKQSAVVGLISSGISPKLLAPGQK